MLQDRRYYLLYLPLYPGTTPLKYAPEYEDWLVNAMRHGANDEFWAQNDILDAPDRYKDIPVYLVGGWYDSWAGNTTANYAALSKKIRGQIGLAHYRSELRGMGEKLDPADFVSTVPEGENGAPEIQKRANELQEGKFTNISNKFMKY